MTKRRLHIIVSVLCFAAVCSLCINGQGCNDSQQPPVSDTQQLPVSDATSATISTPRPVPLMGLQGEGLSVISVGNSSTVEPTHSHPFSTRAVRHIQSYKIISPRSEQHPTCSFPARVGSAYYVFALRRILC